MNIDTRGKSLATKIGIGRARRNHLAQRRLYAAGVTVSALALELRETRARVSAWMAVGVANRPIPRRHAEALLRRYRIPLTAWARIGD